MIYYNIQQNHFVPAALLSLNDLSD